MLQLAQARRVGRRDVDRDVVDQRIEPAQARHIVRDRVGGVAVGADVGADHAPAGPAQREPRAHPLEALAVEAHAVDQGAILRAAGTAAAGGCRPEAAASPCRSRRSRSPAAQAGAQPCAFLSKPAASPSGWGSSKPQRRVASEARHRPAGGRPGRGRSAPDRQPMRGLGRQQMQGPGQHVTAGRAAPLPARDLSTIR